METDHATVNNLLEAITSGNQRAFRDFYDLFYPAIYRFARYFLACGEDCDEVVSEVFCIVWQNRSTFREIRNVESYLYIVCRNEAFRFLRQKEKIKNIAIEDMPVELSIQQVSIEGKLIEEEMLAVYYRAVEELPERCKLIFLMVREEKMKYKEIAHVLSITEGTIEQQMNIAIKKVLATVRKYYPSLFSKSTLK